MVISEKIALRPREMAKAIGIGEAAAYALCHREGFPAVKIGNGYIIPVDALRRWLNDQTGGAAGDII